jgi:lipopolysaccharide export system permease protein
MNRILLNYIIKGFLKNFFLVLSIAYFFGIILNLFEEIEFFKNMNVSFYIPLFLTIIFIPSMIIKLLPFIIFISSMVFMIKLRNSKDLLTLKIFGYSNIKIFFILALLSFFLGWIILVMINPVTSGMSTFYEKTKSNYSKDIDHLINFNRNGLWIKEELLDKKRIISASRPEGYNLIDLKIYHLDKNSSLIEKITAKEANIKNNNWKLNDVTRLFLKDDILHKEKFENYEIESIYNYNKINNLFKNFDTLSFFEIVTNKKNLIERGYDEFFLNESKHKMLSLPFFLFFMTALASIFTMNTLKKDDNFRLTLIGLIVCVITFYLKDLSLALGQTERIPIILAIWSPIIALSFFSFIGILQINEK